MKAEKKKQVIRNGKVYLGAWIDKAALDPIKETAKKEKRTIAAQLEISLYEYNSR